MVDAARAMRKEEIILSDAGPRATHALLLATPVLGYRLVLRPEFEMEGLTVEEMIAQALGLGSVPR